MKFLYQVFRFNFPIFANGKFNHIWKMVHNITHSIEIKKVLLLLIHNDCTKLVAVCTIFIFVSLLFQFGY